MNTPLRLAIILASTRHGRRGGFIAEWFVQQANGRPGVEIDLIDLAEVDVASALVHVPSDNLDETTKRLDEADAFVIVTPEYNHGYTASLKALIDVSYSQWRAKPVGFVSYGGISGGLRAVEQLRQIFAELHAVTVRDSVAFANVEAKFDDQGHIVDPAGPARAASLMLWEIEWWGEALRTARIDNPYAA